MDNDGFSTQAHSRHGAKKKRPLMTLFVAGLLLLAGMLEISRRTAYTQLRALTVQMEQLNGGGQQRSQEEARRIVAEVRELIDIPADVEPTVATIVDVELLKQRNPFYEKAKNGDNLIVTPTRAILYDSKEKKIIDVVPVQIQQQAPVESPPAEEQPAQ